jgi:putative phage-type endonuclease
MSFGNLNIVLNKTIKLINQQLENNHVVNFTKVTLIKNYVYMQLKKEFIDITHDTIDEIFIRLFNNYYTFNKCLSFENGKNCFREFENTYLDINVPAKYKKLNDHFNKLLNLPQPVQRSQEWYDYRFNRITASDTAAAIDQNPYEPVESFILKKCDPNFPFRDNATVFHGKKYEPIATMIYEHIYNTRIFEFGALPSEKYTFLGASPDGISSKYTLDNQFSERLGTMLEIKCPVTREIHTKGKIIGDICPYYYYCQVQQQLACCELDVCDFWQCKISEYKSREEYLLDDCSSCKNTIDTNGTIVDVDNRLKKGIFLEFYPKNFEPEFEGDLAEWKSKYIIPKRLDMDETQYNNWIIKTLDQYKTLYPEIVKDYYFYRIIYWKLDLSHNVSIKRDDNFLANIIPILKTTWDKILYYRKNQDKLQELKNIVAKRTKYTKFNTNYTIYNDVVVKDNYLFLDDRNSKNNKTKKIVKNTDNESDICDFIDNDMCDFIDDNDQKNIKTKVKRKTKKIIKNTDNESDVCDFIDNDMCDFIDDNDQKNIKTKVKNKTKNNIKI